MKVLIQVYNIPLSLASLLGSIPKMYYYFACAKWIDKFRVCKCCTCACACRIGITFILLRVPYRRLCNIVGCNSRTSFVAS
jgi:hypothetical protein